MLDNKDIDKIADVLIQKFADHNVCPNGMDKETVELIKRLLPLLESMTKLEPVLKEIVKIYEVSKKSFWKATLTVIRTGLITIILIGLISIILTVVVTIGEKLYRFFF